MEGSSFQEGGPRIITEEMHDQDQQLLMQAGEVEEHRPTLPPQLVTVEEEGGDN